MKNSNDNFFQERIRGIKFSLRGIWFLIRTESSIQVQLFFAMIAICLGFYFHISSTEWLIQLIVIGLVLVAEALNTGIEKLSDFIHPSFHKRIGLVKDISAGAASIAAIISLVIGSVIYIPKIALLF